MYKVPSGPVLRSGRAEEGKVAQRGQAAALGLENGRAAGAEAASEVAGQAPAVTQQQTQWICCLDPSQQERGRTQKWVLKVSKEMWGIGTGSGVQRKRKRTFLPPPSNSSSHFFPFLST